MSTGWDNAMLLRKLKIFEMIYKDIDYIFAAYPDVVTDTLWLYLTSMLPHALLYLHFFNMTHMQPLRLAFCPHKDRFEVFLTPQQSLSETERMSLKYLVWLGLSTSDSVC